MALSIEVGRDAGCVTLTMAGEIDLGTAEPVHEATLAALRDDRPERLVMDLGAVTFLDSSGIAALIRSRRVCDAYGTALRVVNIQGGVRWVLETAGVYTFLGGD